MCMHVGGELRRDWHLECMLGAGDGGGRCVWCMPACVNERCICVARMIVCVVPEVNPCMACSVYVCGNF
jgi:hypothetical protein